MTTNFDRLFEATRIGIRLRNSGRVYNAPALPPGGRFTGIVNIHGVVDQPEDMVLTDSDIGRAYLEERWALEFLQGIFRTQHVLFVGYSHQDPIIRYPARAMPTGNQPARRFILTHQPTVYGQSWTSLGIEPIVYQLGEEGDHDAAAEAIAEMAEYQRRSPSTWWQLIAQTVSQPNPPVSTIPQNAADRALQDPELTPAFTANAQNLNWIKWCSDRGPLTGVFDHAPAVENPMLVPWVARLLTAHNPDEAIAVIAQGGHRLHPQLWWEISHRLLADGHTTTAATISRWVSYLLSASPANQDTRKSDGLYRLTSLCITHGLYQEAAAIFGELCRPAITVQPRQRPPNQIELTTLGESWMLSASWARIREQDEGIAITVLEQAIREIENRHGILERWGQDTQGADADSSGRHLVGESQSNYRQAGIDEIVTTATDCLEWISQNQTVLLERWLDRLIESPAPLARRLAINTVRTRADWNAGNKVNWLFEKQVPLHSGRALETDQLLIEGFKNLNNDDRQRVVDATRNIRNEGEGR